MDFDKIPTPVLVGGGVVLAFLLMSALSNSGGASVKTMGPAASAGDNSLEMAQIQAQSSSFSSLVNSIMSLDAMSLQAGVESRRIDAAERVQQAALTSGETRARIEAQSELALSRDRGATAKYLARKQAQSNIWGSIFSFGSHIAGLFA